MLMNGKKGPRQPSILRPSDISWPGKAQVDRSELCVRVSRSRPSSSIQIFSLGTEQKWWFFIGTDIEIP